MRLRAIIMLPASPGVVNYKEALRPLFYHKRHTPRVTAIGLYRFSFLTGVVVNLRVAQ